MLLGYGETLTSPIEIGSGGGNKKRPYTYDENKSYLINNFEVLLQSIAQIPAEAMPSNNTVAKITLHPAFLSKSYFPEKIISRFDLKSIGSKSVKIKPRKKVDKKSTKNKENFSTACLYIAGNTNDFKSFLDALHNDAFNVGEKLEIATIEEISLYQSEDKIKGIQQSNVKRPIEVALHTPYSNDSILDSFVTYAENCGATVERQKIIHVNGLTFLPIKANVNEATNVAAFSFLRTIRDLPTLRVHNPVITRTTSDRKSITPPSSEVINSSLQVAIFDGGIGCTDFDPWVQEHSFSNARTSGNLLFHGQDVTSTVLFGVVTENQTLLPTPYTKIDHYRVLDGSVTSVDSDLFDVLIRIKSVLESKQYDYINLSLGPQLPIDDDDVHVWTSTLEQYLTKGQTLCTVAVGNDGASPDGLNRIQPPSDLVNALAVGAASTMSDNWERCSYSCIGPGRSPGYVKPDGIAFGGSIAEPFTLYSPALGAITKTAGTSFSAPLVLRQAICLAASLDYNITPLTAKALLIHKAKNNGHDRKEVGWGRFPSDISNLVYCENNEATVIYQGSLKPSQHMRAMIPFPEIPINGKVTLKSTFCFATPVDAEHPLNYTRSGLIVTFRKKVSDPTKTVSLHNLKSIYLDEEELREDAHRWETTLCTEKSFKSDTLKDPCFDVVYHGRDGGESVPLEDLQALSYVLVVTIKAENTPELYNNIRQRYQTLQPVQVKQDIRLRS